MDIDPQRGGFCEDGKCTCSLYLHASLTNFFSNFRRLLTIDNNNNKGKSSQLVFATFANMRKCIDWKRLADPIGNFLRVFVLKC
jgi:hypothetical protein